MSTTKFSNNLRRISATLAVITMLGAASLVGAQKVQPRSSVPRGQSGTKIQLAPVANSATDFTGDQMNDLVYFDPGTGMVEIHDLAQDSVNTIQFAGLNGVSAAADYDGDGIMDVALTYSNQGLMTWEVQQSTAGAVTSDWGLDTDIPVKGDYDGDGRSDFAVWRANTGQWLILASSTDQLLEFQFGSPTDRPVPGDYDGDNITDVAVYSFDTNRFTYQLSTDQSVQAVRWDIPVNYRRATYVPADYDGDGIDDFAIYDFGDGHWRIFLSSTQQFRDEAFVVRSAGCAPIDIGPCVQAEYAQPADFDNDDIADPGVWNPKESTVTAIGSQVGTIIQPISGNSDMTPISAYLVTK
jgi:hypothetical protein